LILLILLYEILIFLVPSLDASLLGDSSIITSLIVSFSSFLGSSGMIALAATSKNDMGLNSFGSDSRSSSTLYSSNLDSSGMGGSVSCIT